MSEGPKHAWIGCVDDGVAGYRSHCKCGWKSKPYRNKLTANRHLIEHTHKKPRRRRRIRKAVAA